MKKIIILGAGNVGYFLAKTLKERNFDVVLVEINKNHCQKIANTLDVPVIWGNASSASVLRKAGADENAAVVAVTGKDEVNLVACQTASTVFAVKKTIAKSNSPKNVETMKKLGVDTVISSIDTIISLLEREVGHKTIEQLIPLSGGEAAVYEIALPEDFVYSGKEICNITLPDGCNIASITRSGNLIIPRGKTKLYSGDILLVVSTATAVNEVRHALKLRK